MQLPCNIRVKNETEKVSKCTYERVQYHSFLFSQLKTLLHLFPRPYEVHRKTCLTLTSKQKMEPMGLCMARYYVVTDGSQAVVRSEAYSLLAWTEGCTYG